MHETRVSNLEVWFSLFSWRSTNTRIAFRFFILSCSNLFDLLLVYVFYGMMDSSFKSLDYVIDWYADLT
jgi:hypothetical protein